MTTHFESISRDQAVAEILRLEGLIETAAVEMKEIVRQRDEARVDLKATLEGMRIVRNQLKAAELVTAAYLDSFDRMQGQLTALETLAQDVASLRAEVARQT